MSGERDFLPPDYYNAILSAIEDVSPKAVDGRPVVDAVTVIEALVNAVGVAVLSLPADFRDLLVERIGEKLVEAMERARGSPDAPRHIVMGGDDLQ
jgi:hypothetical protein